MRSKSPSIRRSGVGLSFILLTVFLAVLWLAGGASRPDVIGQVLTRTAAWACLIVAVLFSGRPQLSSVRPPLVIASAAVVLALLQLVPLPPAIWTTLPGRGVFLDAVRLAGEPQPWRPLALSPSAATNAAMALVVPLTTLYLLAGLRRHEQHLLGRVLLGMIMLSMFAGLMQFSGAGFNNPLLNGIGEVSGNFANHNHFALFMAVGCLLVPLLSWRSERIMGWHAALAVGFMLILTLTVLASGSRAGTILVAVALAITMVLMWKPVRRTFVRYPRWVFPACVAAVLVLFAVVLAFTVASDRAISIQRAANVAIDNDMRTRGLPVVLATVEAYFPVGSGLGGFDLMFRLHEPFSLLKPTYFNHAHNDFLEIAIDAGLPGIALIVAGIAWWGWASWHAWRRRGGDNLLPRIGSAVILLVILASVVDYPARTPIFMAMLCIAATWLCRRDVEPADASPALPAARQSI